MGSAGVSEGAVCVVPTCTEENGLLIGWVATELTSTPAIHAMTRRTRSRRREPLARPDDAATSVQVGATHTAPSLTPAEPTAVRSTPAHELDALQPGTRHAAVELHHGCSSSAAHG